MDGRAATGELVLIRHAPALHGGRLAGRTDVAADLSDAAALAATAGRAGVPVRLRTSPARRCRDTASALWPGLAAGDDARLWEQDFGQWEGVPFADLPDLGPLSPGALALHRPPGGESFADLCARTAPALAELADGGVTIVAHAGTVRAALALALGSPAAALAFEVQPLSVTRLRRLSGDNWVIRSVNVT